MWQTVMSKLRQSRVFFNTHPVKENAAAAPDRSHRDSEPSPVARLFRNNSHLGAVLHPFPAPNHVYGSKWCFPTSNTDPSHISPAPATRRGSPVQGRWRGALQQRRSDNSTRQVRPGLMESWPDQSRVSRTMTSTAPTHRSTNR